MVIQELKPSKRVKGRWLAVLEDGSILRVGENEVLNFGLYDICAAMGIAVAVLCASVRDSE